MRIDRQDTEAEASPCQLEREAANNFDSRNNWCNKEDPAHRWGEWVCTRLTGHDGPHVAVGWGIVHSRWTEE